MELTEKFAAVVVLYNPGNDALSKIGSYSKFVEKIYVIDNSETPDIFIHQRLEQEHQATIISFNENKGVATALNKGIELAIADDFTWLLTMDQDSSFSSGMIKAHLSLLESSNCFTQVAAIGPHYTTEDIQIGVANVSVLITSGMLVNLKLHKDIGPFNELLFIDEVDREYCLRAKQKGYLILQNHDVFMNHELGTKTEIKLFLTQRIISRTLHSPVRIYYMLRNLLLISRLYKKQFPHEVKVKCKDLRNRTKNRLLYGDQKLYTVYLLFLGYLHFLRGRFGKF